MRPKIIDLIVSSFDKYSKEQNLSVIKNQIPILWFGDYDKYKTSNKKIITVSLNPSNNEFGNIKKNIQYSTSYRFQDFDGNLESLLVAYNNYFKKNRNPYNSWFKASFGSVLKGFEASHYEGEVNTALHTDIAIPFATDPTWTGLSKNDKEYFEPIGQRIWHELVSILEPDIILISASGGFNNKIMFPKTQIEWKVILQKEKYPVLYNQILINNKKSHVIFQTQGRKPFLNLSKEEKLNLKNTLEPHIDGKD